MTADLSTMSGKVQLEAVLIESPTNDKYRFSVNLRKFRHAGERRAVRKVFNTLRAQGRITKGWIEEDIALFDVRIRSEKARDEGSAIAAVLSDAIATAHHRAAIRLQYRQDNKPVIRMPQPRQKRAAAVG